MSNKRSLNPKQGPSVLGPYSPGLQVGPFCFVSGQLPVDPKTNEIVVGDIKKQAARVFENIEAVLKETNLGLRQVVKTTIFLTNMADFDAVNQMYALYFTAPYPSRSCFEVIALPKGASIEVECIAYDTVSQDALYDETHDDCGGECIEDEELFTEDTD